MRFRVGEVSGAIQSHTKYMCYAVPYPVVSRDTLLWQHVMPETCCAELSC